MSGARIFIGLGANLGDPVSTFGSALKKLCNKGCQILGKSHLYRSKPYGDTNQPDFLNAAVELTSQLEPEGLLELLMKVEKELGKTVLRVNGPRVIDLDLLLHGNCVRPVGGDPPVLPHPGVLERDFVLLPLCDLAPDIPHPISGRPLQEHLARLGETFNTGEREVWA